MEFPWQVYAYGMITAIVLVMVWKALWKMLLSETAVKWAEADAKRAKARAEAVKAAYEAWVTATQPPAVREGEGV